MFFLEGNKERRNGNFLGLLFIFFAEREERNFNDGSGKKEENMRDLEGRIFLSSKRGGNTKHETTNNASVWPFISGLSVCLQVSMCSFFSRFKAKKVENYKRWRKVLNGPSAFFKDEREGGGEKLRKLTTEVERRRRKDILFASAAAADQSN